ncbi:MAG: 4-hydroxybenzoate octaprenyltransferase [Parashewanella sp.]
MLKRDNFSAYLQLMRLDKPIGSLLLMWPCLMALFLAADGFPPLSILVIFVAGVFSMRACGCIINDYADRDLDSHVERTKNRPLTSGQVTVKEALFLFALLALVSFGLVLTLNSMVIKLAVVGIVMTVIYPFLKRVTNMPQFFLGVVFGWSIPMAYAAINGELDGSTWWLFAANWCWIVAYDTMYAMVDREDDLKIGIKSTAILFGQYDRLIIGLLQLLALLGFAIAGLSHELSWIYGIGLVAFAGFSLYQQKLIYQRQRQACFKAFLNNNWAGLVLFTAMAADFIL